MPTFSTMQVIEQGSLEKFGRWAEANEVYLVPNTHNVIVMRNQNDLNGMLGSFDLFSLADNDTGEQPTIQKGTSMDTNPNQPVQPQPPVKAAVPSYRSGVTCLIAGIVVELFGRILTGVIAGSARGQGMRNTIATMNTVTAMQGFFDLVMVGLVILGIVLLARTYFARSKAAR